ncbi:MAG: hypothetical protein IJQ85_02400 [Selenomonadaceae bacterium]|nr:hypothetical protein [Selenomonadaceae bacterium]
MINLYLATMNDKYKDFLEYTADCIVVQEKFYDDWSHDTTWGWQQNRGVVGHNLKIAWNLMRI